MTGGKGEPSGEEEKQRRSVEGKGKLIGGPHLSVTLAPKLIGGFGSSQFRG